MHDQHGNPKSDIQIAQETQIRPILDVARTKLGIDQKDLLLYGHHKAKISLDYLRTLNSRPSGKLILVTATRLENGRSSVSASRAWAPASA